MSDRSVKVAIEKLSGQFKADTVAYYIGTVKSVSEDKATCEANVQSGDSTVLLPNILLQSAVCDGMLILPKVGSTINIITSKYMQPIVVGFSDIDKIYMQVGDSMMELDKSGAVKINDDTLKLNNGTAVFNNGLNFGMVKVLELTIELNKLQADINIIKGIFAAWVPVPTDGGTALKIASAAWAGQVLTPTTQAMIENDKVKH